MKQPGERAKDCWEPLHSLILEAIGRGAFPGAAWGVARGGRVLCLGAAGRQTYHPDSPPVTPETVYDLASVTKVVATTAAAMLLFQRGMLDLDTRLGDLLPGFVIAGECGAGRHRVTIRMLLAHASGLPGYAPLFMDHRGADGLLRACLQMPLAAPPGTRTEYSDIGFILLGKALELVTGEPLSRFCDREVFTPLGMGGTGYTPPVWRRAGIPPTERDELFRRRVVQGEVHDENCQVLGGCAGHAGVFAPAGDVLRFAEAMLGPLRNEQAEGERLFTRGTVELFTTRAGIVPGSGRALGWDTPEAPSSSGIYFDPRSFGHLGYTGTSLWVDPVRDLAVVLLTNRTWPSRENKQIQEVRPMVHNLISELVRDT